MLVVTFDDRRVRDRARPRGSGGGTTYTDEGACAAGPLLVGILTFLGYLLGTVACYRAVTDTYEGRGRAPARRCASRAPALWLALLVVLGLVAGFLACVVPRVCSVRRGRWRCPSCSSRARPARRR